jgi:hypothetical protein
VQDQRQHRQLSAKLDRGMKSAQATHSGD